MKHSPVSKADLLQALESVEAGLSPAPTVDQANCLCFRNGRVMTFDGEVFCRAKTPLPKELTCAVPGKPLLEALRGLDVELVDVSLGKDRLWVAAKRDRVYVRCVREVVLPVGVVDEPPVWNFVTPEFSEALAVVSEVPAGKDDQKLIRTVVHLTPRFVQATDGFSFCRYRVKTGLAAPAMLRAKSAKQVADRGPTRVGETERWLHFRTPSGLRMSVRRFDPDVEAPGKMDRFDDVVKQRGVPVQFPKSVAGATKVAEIFASEYSDDVRITVELKPPYAYLVGEGVSGGADHRAKARYEGPEAAFTIGPKLFEALVDKHSEIEIVKGRLIVASGRLFYSTSTKEVSPNGRHKENGDESDR